MQNDEQIIDHLRAMRGTASAIDIADALAGFRGEHSEGDLITYFKRAFPEIPLQVLREAGGWTKLSGGGLSDHEFETLLRPWLGSAR
jgi:hypothetical protein